MNLKSLIRMPRYASQQYFEYLHPPFVLRSDPYVSQDFQTNLSVPVTGRAAVLFCFKFMFNLLKRLC